MARKCKRNHLMVTTNDGEIRHARLEENPLFSTILLDFLGPGVMVRNRYMAKEGNKSPAEFYS